MDKPVNHITARPRRYKFIALLQVLAILMVVVVHSLHEYPVAHGTATPVHNALAMLCNPLFVFASGFLFGWSVLKRGALEPYGPFVRKKLLRIGVPFVVLSVATFFLRCAMNPYADDVVEPTLSNFALSFVHPDHMALVFLWFVLMLFIMFNVAYGIVRMCRGRLGAGFFMAAVPLTVTLTLTVGPYSIKWLCIANVLWFMVYFVLGMAYVRWYDRLNRVLGLRSVWAAVGGVAIWVTCYGLYRHFGASLAGDELWRIQLFVILPGIYGFTALAHCLERYGVTFLDHLTEWVFLIYLLSWYPSTLSQQVLHHFTAWDWWFYTLLSVVTSIYVPVLIGVTLKRAARTRRWARAAQLLLGQNHKGDKN